MVKYWGGGLEVFLEPLFKCSWGFTNVFLITLHPVTFISINDSTSLLHGVLILGSHQEVFDGGTSFELHLHPMIIAHLLEAFTEPSVIRNNNVWFLGVVSSSVLFVVAAFLLSLTSWFNSNSVEDPFEEKQLAQLYTPPSLEKICWWHICHRVITKKSLPGSHQLHWPTYPVYLWRTERRWVNTLPWYIGDS